MDELLALKTEVAGKINEFKALGETLTANDHVATAEETERFNQLDAAIKADQDKIEGIKSRLESDSERASRLNRIKQVGEWKAKIDEEAYRNPNEESDFRGADQDKDLAVAMAGWSRMGCSSTASAPTAEEVEAGKRIGVNIAAGEFKITNPALLRSYTRQVRQTYAEARARGLTAANVVGDTEYFAADTDGLDSRVPERAGYLNRPTEFLNTLTMNEIAYAGILQAPVTIMQTDHYEDVVETYGDDTTHSGRQIGEGQTIGTTLTPNFANITWKAYDFTSDDIPVTNRQLERSRFGLPSYIAQMLGERLGRITGTKCTTGTGAVTPQGIQTATTAMGSYVSSMTTLVIKYDDLIDMQHVLDPIYWNAPGTGWMMHPKVLPLLKKIKDGQGLPVLNLGKEGSGVTTLLGQPIYWNNDMTAPVAGAWTQADKAIIYGQFPRFVIRTAGMPVLIRDETTNRRTLGTIFTALKNFDSRIRDYGVNPLAELRIS